MFPLTFFSEEHHFLPSARGGSVQLLAPFAPTVLIIRGPIVIMAI